MVLLYILNSLLYLAVTPTRVRHVTLAIPLQKKCKLIHKPGVKCQLFEPVNSEKALTLLTRMPVHRRVTPAVDSMVPTFHLGEERHYESKASFPRTQRSDPAGARARTAQSGVQRTKHKGTALPTIITASHPGRGVQGTKKVSFPRCPLGKL